MKNNPAFRFPDNTHPTKLTPNSYVIVDSKLIIKPPRGSRGRFADEKDVDLSDPDHPSVKKLIDNQLWVGWLLNGCFIKLADNMREVAARDRALAQQFEDITKNEPTTKLAV